MNSQLTEILHNLFAFDITAHLLGHDFVQQALLAGALLGLVAGLIGPFIVMRQMSFAVHGSSELSLTGGAFALLVGWYSSYSGLSARTTRLGDRWEREALQRTALCIYSSQWAARSAVEDYGVDPDRIAIVQFGANFDGLVLRWSDLDAKAQRLPDFLHSPAADVRAAGHRGSAGG